MQIKNQFRFLFQNVFFTNQLNAQFLHNKLQNADSFVKPKTEMTQSSANVKSVLKDKINISNEALVETIFESIADSLKSCATKFDFDADQVIAFMGLRVNKEVSAEQPVVQPVVQVSKRPRKGMAKPAFPLPYNGEFNGECCQALKFNGGLYTQCISLPNAHGQYCTSCEKTCVDGVPEFGTIAQRKCVGLMDYVDPKGRKPKQYSKVISKLNLTEEDVRDEAAKFNMVIDPIHFAQDPPRFAQGTAFVQSSAFAQDAAAIASGKKTGKRSYNRRSSKVIEVENENEDFFTALLADHKNTASADYNSDETVDDDMRHLPENVLPTQIDSPADCVVTKLFDVLNAEEFDHNVNTAHQSITNYVQSRGSDYIEDAYENIQEEHHYGSDGGSLLPDGDEDFQAAQDPDCDYEEALVRTTPSKKLVRTPSLPKKTSSLRTSSSSLSKKRKIDELEQQQHHQQHELDDMSKEYVAMQQKIKEMEKLLAEKDKKAEQSTIQSQPQVPLKKTKPINMPTSSTSSTSGRKPVISKTKMALLPKQAVSKVAQKEVIKEEKPKKAAKRDPSFAEIDFQGIKYAVRRLTNEVYDYDFWQQGLLKKLGIRDESTGKVILESSEAVCDDFFSPSEEQEESYSSSGEEEFDE